MRRNKFLRSFRKTETELKLFGFVGRIFESNKVLDIVEATYSNIERKAILVTTQAAFF